MCLHLQGMLLQFHMCFHSRDQTEGETPVWDRPILMAQDITRDDGSVWSSYSAYIMSTHIPLAKLYQMSKPKVNDVVL